VLEADATLGGLAFGLTYRCPEPSVEAIPGAPTIKSATLIVTIDYETDAPPGRELALLRSSLHEIWWSFA
jgi:hypothetical protein